MTAEPISAAGGVVFRNGQNGTEVLLIKRRSVWDLPKGKVESGETINEAARREVAEEVGIPLPQIVEELGTTFHTYREGVTEFAKTTWWFSMISTTETFTPQAEELIEAVEWHPLQEALNMVAFDNLKTVLLRFQTTLK